MKSTSSLRTKILMLVFLPLAASLALAGHLAWKEWRKYQISLQDFSEGQIIHSISVLIHDLQAERGKSAMFLNGAIPLDELANHRSKVDKLIEQVLIDKENVHLDSEVRELAGKMKAQVSETRAKVEHKDPPPEVSAAYGRLVDSLIALEVKASRASSFESELNGPLMLDVAKENTGKIRAALTNILGANKPLALAQIATLQTLMSGINSNLYSPLLRVSQEGRIKIEKFNTSDDWKKVNTVFRTVMEKSSEGNFGENASDFFAAITRSINDLSVVVQGDLTQVKTQIEDNAKKAKQSMIWVCIGIIIGTSIMGLLTMTVLRAITKPINQVVQGLQQSAAEVMNAFHQLRSASHQMSSGTAQSAASLQETVASVEEISSMVSKNADSAEQASQLSTEGHSLAEKGESEIKVLVTDMGNLAESSKQIEDIVEIIDDIAFQINLLALNAAVEAARAGEQGKGFAVVADAVRELAQKSAVAAKDIGQLIHNSVEKTKQGSSAADSSGEMLSTIVASVKKTSTLIQEISSSSQEQAKGLSQITKAMNELDRVTQTNAASAEETSASADMLSTQAQTMQNLVNTLNEIVEGTTAHKAA